MTHRMPVLRTGKWPTVALTAALLCASLLASDPARADFTDGVRAYEAGNYAEAYAQWLPLAEKNDVAAQRNIGHLYRWGQGVEKNIETAMQWYRRAAELGFSRAQANLAAIYLQGEEGVAVNYDEAHKWFAAAAIQGHAVAQYNLGLMFELGLGVEKNEGKALGWYNLAAKSGQPEALERLSQLVKKAEPPPLVSGINLPAASSSSSVGIDLANTATPAVSTPASATTSMPAAPVARPIPAPVTEAPAADPTPAATSVPASSALPAGYLPSVPTPEEIAAAKAAAPVEAPKVETAPVAPQPEPERPGFLARFYNAISSGGGVSIPDIFDSGEKSGETKPGESKP